MDIIISANQTILDMVRSASDEISSEASKEEYMSWLNRVDKDENDEG